MELKTVFTAIFSFIIAFVAQGQSIDETYLFAEKQFLAGNYKTAYNHLSKIVDEESLPELTGIFNHFEKIRKRFRPGKVQTMSTIFPGIGQFYVGNIGSGLNFLVLIGGIGVITIYIWQSYGFLGCHFIDELGVLPVLLRRH